MDLKDLGYTEQFEKFRQEQDLSGYEIGRVVAEHRERYMIRTSESEYEAEITGHMRFTAKSREDFPAVGDWVALAVYEDDFAIIHKIFPRYSIIKRQAVGQSGEVQVIAANIDYAFLIQAADRDFNINRLERYLTICYAAKVTPVIVLTKIDLVNDEIQDEIMGRVRTRIPEVEIFRISNETREGLESIRQFLKPGKTYCMLGSSGVGKSSLLNNLAGKSIMDTGNISFNTGKGRHISSHRELFVLEQGAMLIDNPGMREVGIADQSGGLEMTFEKIVQLAEHCRFKDCTHTQETGCAILEALENGEIDLAAYENYQKMQREKNYFETSQAERKKREKQFGKMYKSHKKDIDRYKGRQD